MLTITIATIAILALVANIYLCAQSLIRQFDEVSVNPKWVFTGVNAIAIPIIIWFFTIGPVSMGGF